MILKIRLKRLNFLDALKAILLYCYSGGPGSGKSTQCEMLKMHTQYIHVSSGEALREEIASGSSRGLAIYNLMYNGEPVPNNIMTGVLRETMLSKIMQKGFDVKVQS